jgi:hypothetical protein
MEISEFQRLLEIGLGRAVIYARDHDVTPYRDAILNACLHNLAYDRQCEGNRAEFMYDIIQFSSEKEFYRKKILTALAGAWEDWDPQVFDLARLFAQDGDVEAHKIIYDTFTKNCQQDHANGVALIKLDGLEGFLFVANQIGAQLLADDASEDDYLLYVLEEKYGKKEAHMALEQTFTENPEVKAYVSAIMHHRSESQRKAENRRPNSSAVSYEQLKPVIDHYRLSLAHWGERASNTDFEQAATDALAELDPRRLRAYLSLFRDRRFPLDHHWLQEQVFSPVERVPWLAIKALAIIAHPDVRALSLSLMDSVSEVRCRAVELLTNNFQTGDHVIVEKFAGDLQDVAEIHSLGFGVLDFYKAHPHPESEARIMLTLYEKKPCTQCREDFVDRLIALNALPDWMREECQYDANPDIRSKVKELQ